MPFILLVSLYFFNHRFLVHYLFSKSHRGGSRTAATSKMDRLVIIVNGWKLLTIITKCSILDVAENLDFTYLFFIANCNSFFSLFSFFFFFFFLQVSMTFLSEHLCLKIYYGNLLLHLGLVKIKHHKNKKLVFPTHFRQICNKKIIPSYNTLNFSQKLL